MKQVVQSIRSGELRLLEVPRPLARPGYVLIANTRSLVSAGTEKAAMELARKSLLGKARERPDHVRRVLEKVRDEGLLSTFRQVSARLDEPMPMGYCSAGIVLACGAGVQELKPGDRVVSNGPHAEVVSVGRNLCARIPDGLDFDRAVFTVLGSIALQGVRLGRVTVGETAFVIGLGLVGQLAVAILKAAGATVIGTDLDASKCELAVRMGAKVARPGLGERDVADLTGGLGADAVIIAASTKSKDPMDLAAGAIRKKGRIVLVGVVGLELDRRPFYFKECEFVVSSSYGPGRYDPAYEERGQDYPAAYVRWTEQRNFSAVLELMASGRLDPSPLLTHRFPVEKALEAYDLIEKGSEPYLGVVLEYPGDARETATVEMRPLAPETGKVGLGCLGAGNFARSVLLPALAKAGRFEPVVLCSASGLSARQAGERLGFAEVTADEAVLINDPRVKAVFVLTRHDQHARQVALALSAGKHVFCEKPLALNEEELVQVEAALGGAAGGAPLLMVGFNRRFSPAARQVRSFFEGAAGPRTASIRFNAGAIPPEHWTQVEEIGGGRIVGEACHAIDLATFLIGAPPVRVFAESVKGGPLQVISDDQAFITMRHADGSISNVAYLSGGDRSYPKERVEVLGGGRLAVIEDFREVVTCVGGKRKMVTMRQDKGHEAEVQALSDALLSGGQAPIPWPEIRAVTLASILAVRSLREGVPFDVPRSGGGQS